MQAVEAEVADIYRAHYPTGTPFMSTKEWMAITYPETAAYPTLLDCFHRNPAYNGICAPRLPNGVLDLQHRFLAEDIPYGLELMQRMARSKDVTTPFIDMLCAWYRSTQ